jgi:hypothetical protein
MKAKFSPNQAEFDLGKYNSKGKRQASDGQMFASPEDAFAGAQQPLVNSKIGVAKQPAEAVFMWLRRARPKRRVSRKSLRRLQLESLAADRLEDVCEIARADLAREFPRSVRRLRSSLF